MSTALSVPAWRCFEDFEQTGVNDIGVCMQIVECQKEAMQRRS